MGSYLKREKIIRRFFGLSISGNIRNFLWMGFFYFLSLDWKMQGSIYRNIKKAFFLRKYKKHFQNGFFKEKPSEIYLGKNFEGWGQKVKSFIYGNIKCSLILDQERFPDFLKYKEFFSRWICNFFSFLYFGWKVHQVTVFYTILILISSSFKE